MYTVLELPGKEDIITDYVNQISSRKSSRLLIDEDVVNSFDKYASSSIKISNLQRFKKDDI